LTLWPWGWLSLYQKWVPGIFPGGKGDLTTFMCRLSWNLGASTSWYPQDLSRAVMGLLYLLLPNNQISAHILNKHPFQVTHLLFTKRTTIFRGKVEFYKIIRGQQPRQLSQIQNGSETDFVSNLRVLRHLRIPREWRQSHPPKRWYLNYSARSSAPKGFYRIRSPWKPQNLE
jgi:hypothetical protein